MDSKDKYITLSIFFIGWMVLLISTSLPLFYISQTQVFSLDKITWTMWNVVPLSICGLDSQICHWLYGNYENLTYSGWFSFNFLIILLVGYPFIHAVRFLKNGSYFFGQRGLKQFALSVILYNLFVLYILYSAIKPIWRNVSFGNGLIFYLIGLILVYLSVFYGIRRSYLDRDSNYQ